MSSVRSVTPASRMPAARSVLAGAGAALLALSLAGCGAGSASTSSSSVTTIGTAEPGSTAAESLSFTDPWVKTAASDMTAAFGVLHNAGSAPITVVSAKTSASQRTELHEVVMDGGQMKMQPKNGGFVIPAGGSLELKPGGYHIMIMDLAKPVVAGQEVTLRLTLSDGSTFDASALAKDTTAGEEHYHSDGAVHTHESSPMSSPMSMAPSASSSATGQ